MGIVIWLPFQQVIVPPVHESVQVCPSRRGHIDQVTAGPDLQPHQSDEGPQGLVCLKEIREREVTL